MPMCAWRDVWRLKKKMPDAPKGSVHGAFDTHREYQASYGTVKTKDKKWLAHQKNVLYGSFTSALIKI